MSNKLLSSDWKNKQFNEIVGFVVDNRGKTPPMSENEEYELIEVNAIGENERTPNYAVVRKFVNKNTFTNWFRKGTLKSGDVLIPTVGTIGNVAFSMHDRGAIAQNLIALRTNEHNDPLFLYYYLSSPYAKRLLLSLDIGGVQPSIKVPHLLRTSVLYPDLHEQKAIAAVLSSFDDKIELLKQENETLEKIAQTIFDEWFGKYQVGDELPEGWESLHLGDIAKTTNGYAYKGKELVEESEKALVTLKSFDRNGGFQIRGFKPFNGEPKLSQEVKIGDLIVAHTDLTQDAEVLGNPAIVFDDSGYKQMFITMDLVKVESIEGHISNSFLYYLMKTRLFKHHCKGYANGTTVLHLSKKAIPKFELILPRDKNKINQFSNFSNIVLDKISINIKQIQILSKTRDVLLPKLMSGKVRTYDAN